MGSVGRSTAARRAGCALISAWAILASGPDHAAATAGDLDPSFGRGGVVVLDPGPGDSPAVEADATAEGGLVVAGTTGYSDGRPSRFLVARLRGDGGPDASFGGGVVTASFPQGGAEARAVAALPDGRVVAAGRVYTGSRGRFGVFTALALARYRADGSLDPTFGAGGLVTTGVGERIGIVEALAPMPDGRLVAAGRAYQAVRFDDRPVVARYLADGRPDPSFGTGGVVVLDVRFGIHDAAVLPDGRVLVAGQTSEAVVNTAYDVVVARLLPNGSPDPAFGAGGIVTTDLGGGDLGRAVAVLPDGDVAVAAYAMGGRLEPDRLAVMRYDRDGRRDLAFGTDGVSWWPTAGASCVDGAGLVVQPDGKMLVGGGAGFAALRLEPDGRRDPSFAPAPLLPSGGYACARDVDLGADGSVAMAGTLYAGGRILPLLARFEGQAPTLSISSSVAAPVRGTPFDLVLVVRGPGYMPMRGMRLRVDLPPGMSAAGAPAVAPPGAAAVGDPPDVATGMQVAPASAVTVTLPVSLTWRAGPGDPQLVEARLEPGPGHHPVTARVAVVPEGPPRPAPDRALTAVDTPTWIPVLANDVEPNGDAMTVIAVEPARHGEVSTDGLRVLYAPEPGFVGTDGFAYLVSDSHSEARAEVEVVVAERLHAVWLPFAHSALR